MGSLWIFNFPALWLWCQNNGSVIVHRWVLRSVPLSNRPGSPEGGDATTASPSQKAGKWNPSQEKMSSFPAPPIVGILTQWRFHKSLALAVWGPPSPPVSHILRSTHTLQLWARPLCHPESPKPSPCLQHASVQQQKQAHHNKTKNLKNTHTFF